MERFGFVSISRERNFHLLRNEIKNEWFEIALYATLLVLVPLLFHQQLVTGTLVNAILIKAALDYRPIRILLLSLVPSAAAFAGGFLFGPLTPMLLYMMPFIWVGNISLSLIVRKMFIKRRINYALSSIAAAAVKTLILFASAFTLFSLALVPVAFLTAFGILQLFTALGGAAVVGAFRLRRKR